MSFMDHWDSSSDSDTEDRCEDSYMRYEEIISRYDTAEVDNAWTYVCRSDRGGEVYGNLPKRHSPDSDFKLKFNPTDAMLLKKAKVEIAQSLKKARRQLFLVEEHQPIDPAAAFAAVLPRQFLEYFHDYLKTSLKENEHATWTFSDIMTFLRCEVLMRIYDASAAELEDYGVTVDEVSRFQRVRKALTKADKPASKRRVVDGGAQLPACTFDPILNSAIDACNKHWTDLFFVAGNSWCDIDDDKIPNTSPLWKQFGMKMTPTKDKKLKPVFHVMAVIGAGYVCWVAPDILKLKLGDMLNKAILHVSPTGQQSQRASLAFFIDRGYLELARAQGVNITNLIQIMESLGVKFLGTIKDSKSFPFQIVDLNESSNTVVNNRTSIQGYVTRSSYTAQLGTKTASVMRHGAGKVRAARAATNLVECRQDTWAYETDVLVTRMAHVVPLLPIQDNATIGVQFDHAWNAFLLLVTLLTLSQRTAEWFMQRYFRFTSTTLHVSLNVKVVVYLNTTFIQEVHTCILNILRLKPRKTIMVQSTADLEDEDLPTQCTHHVQIEGQGEQGSIIGDEKCTQEYWMRGNPKVDKLQKLCEDHGVPFNKEPPT